VEFVLQNVVDELLLLVSRKIFNMGFGMSITHTLKLQRKVDNEVVPC